MPVVHRLRVGGGGGGGAFTRGRGGVGGHIVMPVGC